MIMLEKDRLAVGKALYSFQNAAFKEEDHPRAEDGKFGKESGGGNKKTITKKTVKTKQEIKKIEVPKNAMQSPDGTKAHWDEESGGTLFHGTSAPDDIEYLDGDSDGVVYLTDDYKEAEGYAKGVHFGGGKNEGTQRVLDVSTTGGKMLSVDDEINKLVEDGEDDFSPVFEKARQQGASFVFFSHPSNYDENKEQRVYVALNPGDTLGPARKGVDIKTKKMFKKNKTNASPIKVYRAPR